jgi:prepilin-type N-terminal cleavage/methylation domain-containing protein
MNRSLQQGFSLLELLVALFVVMVITSLVTLNVSSGGKDIELEAKVRSLADISAYALDEAQMSGVDMGLVLERSSTGIGSVYRYSWRERRLEGWRQPELDKDIFATGEFPEDVELQLVLENLPVSELVADPDASGLNPQIVFYASGEITPGYMELRERRTGEILWLIEWDMLGRFTLLPRGVPIDDEYDDE